MATISAKIYKHHKKADGTYNVKVCIFHKGQRRYINTNHYLVGKQLTSKFKIKDRFIADLVERQLIDYRRTVSELGNKLSSFSAEALRDYIRDKDADIDFIAFCEEHIQKTKLEGREGTAHNHSRIKNSLIDYFGRQTVSVTEINSAMLYSYECYLKSERKMERINQLGKIVVINRPAMSEIGLHNHMRDLRTLFNEARDFYNNEDLEFNRIKHYPFKKYKLGPAPLAKKRNNSIEEILRIKDCITEPGSRAELAKELFILSFLTCGMNAVDLYNCTNDNIRDGRINYNRTKTKRKRRDDAFISIKIVEEARLLLIKYIGKLQERYATYGTLDSALSKGMREVCKRTGLDGVTFYWARYTFANLARNSCRMSKDDVLLAMNHVDMASRMVDIYIERDWKIVDEVQLKVLQLYREADTQLITNDELQYEEYYY
jgi:integrase